MSFFKNVKTAFKGIGKYLREVSVVVIGVAITFAANDRISSRNEQKDMQRYLNAVKIELEGNLKIVDKEIAYYQQANELRDYLRTHKPEEMQLDSIEKYNVDKYRKKIIQNVHVFQYKKTAFETFKMSGAMRLLKDKALLTIIWDTYDQLEEIKQDNDDHMQRKGDELYNLLLADGRKGDYDIRTPEAKRMRVFLMLGIDLESSFRTCSNQILEALSVLDPEREN